MTKIYDVNRIATYGGSTCVFYLKQTLVSASWVVSASSDGTTYFNGSDGITTDNSGSGGMNNPLAWYAIRDPSNRRMLTVQRSSASSALFGDQMWRVATFEDVSYGVQNGTVTSALEAINTDSAGYVVACGSGSALVPLFERMFETSGSFRCHTIVISESYNGVYPWYNLTSTTGSLTGRTTSLWHQEPFITSSFVNYSPLVTRIQSCFVASYGFGASYASNYSYYSTTRATTGVQGSCYAWINYGLSTPVVQSSSIQTTSVTIPSSQTPTVVILNDTTISPDGTDWVYIPFYLCSRTTGTYFNLMQGYSKYIRIGSRAAYAAAGRKYPDTTTLTTDAYVFAGPLLIPWPESVTPTS